MHPVKILPGTAGYNSLVEAAISENGVHAEVVIDRSRDRHSITSPTAPLSAVISTNNLEDDTISVFSTLVGVSHAAPRTPADFLPLVNMLAPEFKFTRIEYLQDP